MEAKQPAEEHHGREYIIGGIGAVAEYLALRYGISWLAWFAAFLLWLAVVEYTRRWASAKGWIYVIWFGLFLTMGIATYYLIREKPAPEIAKTSQPAASQQNQSAEPAASKVGSSSHKEGQHHKSSKAKASPKNSSVSTTGDNSPATGSISQQDTGSAVSINQQGGITAGTINLAAADPYAGVDDKTVGRQAIEEADRIEQMGKKCGEAVVQAQIRKNKGMPMHLPDAPGPEFVQVQFRQEFDSCCKPAIIKLHDSLTLRLGPAALDASEERDYKEIVDFSERLQQSWPLCMQVQSYAGELRQMGEALVER